MDGGRGDLKETLQLCLRRGATIDPRVVVDEDQILALLVGVGWSLLMILPEMLEMK
jgi:hypothetical protein